MAHLFWPPDEAWEAMDPYLPRGRPGKPRVDGQRGISGILHALKTGCRWRDVSPEYGSPTRSTTAQPLVPARPLAAPVREAGRHRRGSRGTEPRQFSRGGTPARRGRKGREWTQAVRHPRGGRTSKIHCLASDRGRPLALALTPGNVADITIALPLLQPVARSRRLIADKAYDAESLRRWLQDKRIKAVIPPPRPAPCPTRSTAAPISAATSSSVCSAA
jgi:transposase